MRTTIRLLVANAAICWIFFGDQETVTASEFVWSAVFMAGLNVGMLWFRPRSRIDGQVVPRPRSRT